MQIVSDYLTADNDTMLMMRAKGRPVVVYSYRMALRRAVPPVLAAVAEAAGSVA